MLAFGKVQKLKIARIVSVGAFLSDGKGNEVLLPKKYVDAEDAIGDELEVFIFNDTENRPVAIKERPSLLVGEIGFLKAVNITVHGAFMEWGISKDLFVHFKEQYSDMEVGKYYPIYVYLDEQNRMAGSSIISKSLSTETQDLEINQEVNLLILRKTEIGYEVVIDNTYKGLLYQNQVFQPINQGDRLKGYIQKIREDNKVDVSLKPSGYVGIEGEADELLQKLKDFGGFLPLHDKSSPEDIKETLNMSKKAFKKMVGLLYKNGQIELTPKGIKSLTVP